MLEKHWPPTALQDQDWVSTMLESSMNLQQPQQPQQSRKYPYPFLLQDLIPWLANRENNRNNECQLSFLEVPYHFSLFPQFFLVIFPTLYKKKKN